ncbi:MAG: hypothetical protein K8W52_11945 [Deltaproteobacteria bacterium]|nr:hypothetical protein [Deltaproteobacteria bacterium]
MMSRAVRVLFLFVILGWAGGALAQPAGGGGKREKIKQQILALRAWMITRELSLDEATAGKVFPVLAKYDDQFAKILRENLDLRREAEAAAARNDDKALDGVVDKFLANQRARWAIEEARFKDVRRLLTPAQAARLVVMLPKVDRRLQLELRKALRPAAGHRRGRGRGRADDTDTAPAPDDDSDEDAPY